MGFVGEEAFEVELERLHPHNQSQTPPCVTNKNTTHVAQRLDHKTNNHLPLSLIQPQISHKLHQRLRARHIAHLAQSAVVYEDDLAVFGVDGAGYYCAGEGADEVVEEELAFEVGALNAGTYDRVSYQKLGYGRGRGDAYRSQASCSHSRPSCAS